MTQYVIVSFTLSRPRHLARVTNHLPMTEDYHLHTKVNTKVNIGQIQKQTSQQLQKLPYTSVLEIKVFPICPVCPYPKYARLIWPNMAKYGQIWYLPANLVSQIRATRVSLKRSFKTQYAKWNLHNIPIQKSSLEPQRSDLVPKRLVFNKHCLLIYYKQHFCGRKGCAHT